jgi:rhodanese-related sulfurtransferase
MDRVEFMNMTNQNSRVALHAMVQAIAILVLACAIALSVNQFRPGGLPLEADWSPEAQLTLDSGDSLMISLEEAGMLFFDRSALFVDARSSDEYAEGHIEGAVNLPWDEFDQHFALVMADVSPVTPLVTYCDGEGCALSKELAMALLAKGYTNVRVLVNGWTLWQEKRLPVEMSENLSHNQ